MAVEFKKPKFQYDYTLQKEKAAFDAFFSDPARAIPPKKANEIDLASWNIANLGLQKRRGRDLKLIAHILSKFDIIAVQEVNEDLAHFFKIMEALKDHNFEMMLTDTAGNSERLAVIYRTDVLRPRQLFSELDYNPKGKIIKGRYTIVPKNQSFSFKGKKVRTKFYNFNRNPFLSTWEVIGKKTTFMLANVHIYFGKKSIGSAKYNNRIAEVHYLADWAAAQRKKKTPSTLYEGNIILIGDMNIPKMKSDDRVYRALARRGMKPTRYSTSAGTTIQEFRHFDQIVFTGDGLKVTKIKNQSAVVVDYDNFVFRDLWKDKEDGKRTSAQFKAWTKFAVSDHRPIFVRLKV